MRCGMTQYERMVRGLIYDPGDSEIMEEQMPLLDRLWEFNQLKPSQTEAKQRYMKEVFAECGEGCYIELPFHANWGGRHVHFGSGIYANFNLTVVDDGHLYVGDKVMFGPNVVVATANHPLDAELRGRALQYNKDVYIGENAWIGAAAVIVPGVRIGKNAIIGAGSVVTKDIPDDVLAAGNPCRVIRAVSEHDREFFYKDEKIDWEALGRL
ncbi:MAG: sugar O-acetyltransferase [Ruminococcaceae bacterium]|nr:sugar O-acetyltransferase [Oscillospiraceae bacterium]